MENDLSITGRDGCSNFQISATVVLADLSFCARSPLWRKRPSRGAFLAGGFLLWERVGAPGNRAEAKEIDA